MFSSALAGNTKSVNEPHSRIIRNVIDILKKYVNDTSVDHPPVKEESRYWVQSSPVGFQLSIHLN